MFRLRCRPCDWVEEEQRQRGVFPTGTPPLTAEAGPFFLRCVALWPAAFSRSRRDGRQLILLRGGGTYRLYSLLMHSSQKSRCGKSGRLEGLVGGGAQQEQNWYQS